MENNNQKQSNPKILLGLLTIFALILLTSCQNNPIESQNQEDYDSIFLPKHSNLFHIEYYKNHKKIFVKNPWDSTQNLAKYIVSLQPEKQPENSGFTLVKTPLKSIATLFAPDVAFANKLEIVNLIRAVSSIQYVHNEQLNQQVEEGKTIDVGPSEAYNVEKLIASGVVACFVSPFRENRYQKIEEAEIALIVNACHTEDKPLARAEWILFFASFFDKEEIAKEIFQDIENQYNSTKSKFEDIKNRPKVFSGKMYQDIWYVSGGKSFTSELFNDAGGDYIWKHLPYSGSEPYDLEIILSDAINADFWFIQDYTDTNYNYQRLASENAKYSLFDAFKNQNVVLCNSKYNSYYEDGVLEPHIILMDMAKVFHPEIMEEHQFKYFKPLKK